MNLEFKGTKGKWYADKNTTFGGKNSIVVSENKGVIITLNPASFDSDEEMIANANLIASAPELLKSLTDMILLFENHSSDEEMEESNDFQKAKKLIEKVLM